MSEMDITQRQAEVLRKVVETHVSHGQPVGSKWLAEQANLPWRPSTIRAELAKLEELGLLQHPHTSADHPVGPGLVDWAGEYLNEALGGMALGARMIPAKLADPGLGAGERDFLGTLAPAFTELEESAEDTLFVEGAGRLLSEDRVQELSQIDGLMQLLERRVLLLSLLREALTEPSVYLRIGHENRAPALHSLSIVAANYGIAGRNLGAVSVVGPVR